MKPFDLESFLLGMGIGAWLGVTLYVIFRMSHWIEVGRREVYTKLGYTWRKPTTTPGQWVAKEDSNEG